MAELAQKIKKKVYRFDIKRKFQYEGHYKIKERPPIERIKDQIRALTAPKKEQKKAAESAPPPGGFNFVVFGSFIFIALIVLVVAWLYLTTQVLAPGVAVFKPQVEKASVSDSILSSDVLDTGTRNSPQRMSAVFIDYKTTNLKNYTVNLTTYDTILPSEVFILNSERIEAAIYPDFIRNLRSDLAKRKILLNEITIKQLETMPQGAVVIIPSGTIPKEILGFESRLTIQKIVDRGIVVIYAGKPFNQMLNGTLEVFTPKDVLDDLPMRFDESASLSSSEGFHLFQPLYRAQALGGWEGSLVYGSVSIAKKGNGAFVILPQTLDGGWRSNASAAADDIARIVFQTPWAQPNAQSNAYVLTNQTNYSGVQYFFSEPFDSTSASAKVEFTGYSPASNFPIQETLLIYTAKPKNNSLFIEEGGKVVSAKITNLPVRMNAQLREPVASQPNMFLIVTDRNGTDIQNFPQGNVNTQADRSFDVLIDLDRGEYIVKLMDDLGTLYAQTYMKVVSIDILPSGNDRNKKSIYLFNIEMDGTPKELADVTVKVDGGQYGAYKFNNVDTLRVDVGQYTGGEMLPLGKHTFEFVSGSLKVTVPIEHSRAKTIFDDPIFWLTVIFTGGIVGVGVLFAKQEAVFFSIDIPDFPPVARTRIPLSSETVLSVFEKVNEMYRWQNTPLTPPEMKNGFKDIFVQGRPIYITDYNIEYLLVELEKKGLVKESLGYFGLSEWEAKSRHTLEYLALLRRLRDICVNNAIPFTGIGEAEEADSVITVVGQQMSVHFYERGMSIKDLLSKVIPTIGKGIAILMFKSKADKEHFQTVINSSPTVAPLIVKMEADSSSLLLLDADELEKMLIEFKSM